MRQVHKLLIFIMLITPFLTGCWNSRELNELSITSALGIDKIDDKYLFTVQIINPSEVAKDQQGRRTVVTTLNEEGDTIFEAWRKLTTETATKLYFSHVRVLIIGESLAREGMNNILDTILRDHEYRSDFTILVSKDYNANDILSILTTMDEIPGDKLFKSIKSSSTTYGTTKDETLDKFISEMADKGKNPVVTSVFIVGDKEEGKYQSKFDSIQPETYLKYGPLGAFSDDHLIDWMDDKESRGYNFSQGNIQSTLVNVPCVDGEGLVGVEVIETKASITAEMSNKQPTANIQVSSYGNIMDSECEQEQAFDDPKYIEKFQTNMSETIKTEIEAAVDISQQSFKSDILGIGNALHRANPRGWKKLEGNWPEIYPSVPISVIVETEIHNTGSISLSPKPGG